MIILDSHNVKVYSAHSSATQSQAAHEIPALQDRFPLDAKPCKRYKISFVVQT